MAENTFQPQVAEVNSSVTPQEGVVDTSAVDLFADVAKVATEATFSFTGQQELGELKTKFERITQARAAGGNSTMLQVKARTALDTARANSPWVAGQAEKLFKETFSGGSSTGVFSATPEEKARDKHLQTVEETRLALGLTSSEEAQKRLSMDANAKSAKIQADAQKEARTYNGDLVFANTQTQLVNGSVKVMDALNRAMVQGGGSLNTDATRSFNLTVDQETVRLKSELNSQVRDPKTGHLLVDKGGYEDNLKEIEDWAASTKSLIGDNTTTKVIQDANTQGSAEINALALNNLPLVKFLNAAGGQSLVQSYFEVAGKPEGASKQTLINRNPILKEVFRIQGSFTQAGLTGLDKLIIPTPQAINLNQAEAFATGSVLNDPANAKITVAVVEEVANTASSAEVFESLVAQNPDASAAIWSGRVKAFIDANPASGDKTLRTTLQGLKKSFDMASAMGGEFVTGFSMSRFSTPKAPGVLTASGQGITSEHSSPIRNVNTVFNKYPKFLKEYGTANGNPDMGADEATELYLTGNTSAPEGDVLPKEVEVTDDVVRARYENALARANTKVLKDAVFKAAISGQFSKSEDGGVHLPKEVVRAPKSQSKPSSQVSEATPPQEEIVDTKVDTNKEATLSKEALILQPFIDRGFTKEQMLETLSSLGFAKNGLNDRMIAIIEESFNG